ncbi:MAG: DUF928 domain-containing protein [Stigonema ocellatum SAG 48.90 = DSM 106950]|nr:DUF928 domain-containing protein [Stigonema ocellatum SAG 48.90 = DSM 106950]
MINQTLNTRVVTGCVVTLLLAITPAAIADYVPPPDQKPPTTYSKSGGVRSGGCPQDKILLTVLAPKRYVGKTTSSYPTFAWFVSNSSPVEFRLFQFDPNGKPKQIGEKLSLPSSPGINKYSLPNNQPGLVVGQKYLWQVSIKCSQSDLIEGAEFTVIQMPSTLSSQLSTTKDGLKKVELYGQAGLWYNALEEALKLTEDKNPKKAIANLLQDLAKSEEPDAKSQLPKEEVDQKRINNLKQIANYSM